MITVHFINNSGEDIYVSLSDDHFDEYNGKNEN